MKVTSVSKSVIALSIVGGLVVTSAATAGQPATMAEWKAEANASINKVMTFPVSATHRAATGSAQFRVTVGRDGRIIASEQKIRPSSHTLNFASKNAVRRVQFPELPDNYAADKLTFTLNLNYQSGRNIPHRQKLRRGTVSGSDIATNSTGIELDTVAAD